MKKDGSEKREQDEISNDHQDQEVAQSKPIVGGLFNFPATFVVAQGSHPLIHGRTPAFAHDNDEDSDYCISNVVEVISWHQIGLSRGIQSLHVFFS